MNADEFKAEMQRLEKLAKEFDESQGLPAGSSGYEVFDPDPDASRTTEVQIMPPVKRCDVGKAR